MPILASFTRHVCENVSALYFNRGSRRSSIHGGAAVVLKAHSGFKGALIAPSMQARLRYPFNEWLGKRDCIIGYTIIPWERMECSTWPDLLQGDPIILRIHGIYQLFEARDVYSSNRMNYFAAIIVTSEHYAIVSNRGSSALSSSLFPSSAIHAFRLLFHASFALSSEKCARDSRFSRQERAFASSEKINIESCCGTRDSILRLGSCRGDLHFLRF